MAERTLTKRFLQLVVVLACLGDRSIVAADARHFLPVDRPSPRRAGLAPDRARSFSETSPRCIDIPPTLTACRRFGYTQMRLPNLLNHTTAVEVVDASATFFGSNCSDGGQGRAAAAALFYCSLLTPVCLDRPIRPCASLCRLAVCGDETNAGRLGSASKLLDCDQLPNDDEICIGMSAAPADSAGRVSEMADLPADRVYRRPPARPVTSLRSATETSLSPAASSAASVDSNVDERRVAGAASRHRGGNRKRKQQRAVDANSYYRNRTLTCDVCDQLFSVGDALRDVLCRADFVAKIRPERYIRTGSNLKITSTGRAVRFYKLQRRPSSGGAHHQSSSHRIDDDFAAFSRRRRSVFFVPGGAACDCFAADDDDVDEASKTDADEEQSDGLLVVGTRQRRRNDRLVVTGAMPFRSRLTVRRILRDLGDRDDCARTTAAVGPSSTSARTTPDGVDLLSPSMRRNAKRTKSPKSKLLSEAREGRRRSAGKQNGRSGIDDPDDDDDDVEEEGYYGDEEVLDVTSSRPGGKGRNRNVRNGMQKMNRLINREQPGGDSTGRSEKRNGGRRNSDASRLQSQQQRQQRKPSVGGRKRFQLD